MRVTKSIGPLIGGVSQTPSHMRSQEYASEQINALAHVALGTTKRPGTRHIVKLANSADSHYGEASIFPFVAGDKRRYFVSVAEGELRVVEADTGIERAVSMSPGADAYLSGTLDPDRAFSAAVSGDSLYLVNRARIAGRGTESEPLRSPEGLIYIRSGDFATEYAVRLNGRETRYRTSDGNTTTSQAEITAEAVAVGLAGRLQLDAGAAFTLSRSGSVIRVTRVDGQPFLLEAVNSAQDSAVMVLMAEIGDAIDLPPNGVDEGYTVRVQGDRLTGKDDYWLKWSTGMWRECARPGSLISLDSSTLPHVLVLGGALHDGIEVPALPADPAIGGAAPAITLAWDNGNVAAGSLSINSGEYGEAVLTAADGNPAKLTARFTINTTDLDAADSARVSLYEVHGDGTTTLLMQWSHGALPSIEVTKVEYTYAYTAGMRVRFQVDSVTGGGAVLGNSHITFNATGVGYGSDAGLSLTPVEATQVQVSTVALYPAGAILSITVDGANVSVTVPPAGYTGAQLAAAVAAAWADAGVVCYDAGAGQLVFRHAFVLGSSPVITGSLTFSPSVLFVPSALFVSGSLGGLPLLNVTTGASATITSNTDKSLTFGPLSGGSSTELRPGDLVRILTAPDTFAFAPVTWEQRTAGDDDSNPFPSFIGRTISDVKVQQNRLVLVSSERYIASASAKFGRFFRSTTQQVLDSDVIDVRGSASHGLPFIHAVEWNGVVNLLNGRSLFAVNGEPTLTPRSVGFEHVYEVSVGARCVPLVVGRTLYIARVKNGRTQLLALDATGQGVGVDSVDASAEVPEYLLGEPVMLASDADSPLILITEQSGVRYLYAMQPINLGRSTLFSWARWTLDSGATPLAASLEGGDLLLIIQRADGVYLESIDTLAHLT